MTQENTRYEVGVIHGRFQILHNDHMKYLLSGKERCLHLVVGITNAEPEMIREEKADPQRSTSLANPLTYFERYQLVRCALVEGGVAPQDLTIVPLPISEPERYRYYVPLDAVFFLSIYDDWGRRKKEYFASQGLKTDILREVRPEEKGISASEVRQRMIDGQEWQTMVPPCVAGYLEKWNIPQRLRDLAGG